MNKIHIFWVNFSWNMSKMHYFRSKSSKIAKRWGLSVPSPLKGILNPNFRPFSFELNKNRFFKMNFDLVFRVLWPQKLKIFKIIFPLSSLMTSFLENLKPHDWLLTSIELSRQFNTYELRPNIIKNPAVNLDF